MPLSPVHKFFGLPYGLLNSGPHFYRLNLSRALRYRGWERAVQSACVVVFAQKRSQPTFFPRNHSGVIRSLQLSRYFSL